MAYVDGTTVDRTTVDGAVLDWVVAHRTPFLTDAFTVITTAGNTVAVTAATLVIAAVLARAGRRVDATVLVLTMFTGWLVMNGLKFAFRRPRPPMPQRLVEIDTYSFPSGHAMMAAMFALTVAVVVAHRNRGVVFACLGFAALATGWSRVYLAAHWVSDVVAGWVFGVVWVTVAVAVSRKVRQRSDPPGGTSPR